MQSKTGPNVMEMVLGYVTINIADFALILWLSTPNGVAARPVPVDIAPPEGKMIEAPILSDEFSVEVTISVDRVMIEGYPLPSGDIKGIVARLIALKGEEKQPAAVVRVTEGVDYATVIPLIQIFRDVAGYKIKLT